MPDFERRRRNSKSIARASLCEVTFAPAHGVSSRGDAELANHGRDDQNIALKRKLFSTWIHHVHLRSLNRVGISSPFRLEERQ